MIFIAGMTVAVFFEVLLLAKKRKSGSDRILAFWMFLITLHLFLFYLAYTGEIFNAPSLLGVGLPLPVLHGVFLYLYVASVTDALPRRRWVIAAHFLPAAAMYLYLLTFFVLPAEAKITVFRNQGAGYETFNALRSVATGLSGVAYVVTSLVLLLRHRRRVMDHFSFRDKVDFRWLGILVWGMGGIWLLVFFADEAVLFAGVTVFVFLIGFFGIRQERVFSPPDPAPAAAEPEKEKYGKSGLSPELAERLYGDLIGLMERDGLFRKNDLSTDDLAGKLKTHPNYVSQVINEKEGRNFYDFVNRYRLEAFKQAVSDPKNRHLTLLAVAFECGFNSKSSFNRHFRKTTGKTPSEYAASLTPP